jgi:alpha-ketoglutarate-dependent taurine dioxygenase
MEAKLLNNSGIELIYNQQNQNILELSAPKILEQFKSHGLILFRGFRVDREQMKFFVDRFSSGFVTDPTKDNEGFFDDWLVQLADGGTHQIAPHCENASTPFGSDIIWFCCAVPVKGGETFFWNGVKVWEELSESIKQLFLSKKVRYWRDIPVEQWKSFLGEDSAIANVKQMLDNIEGIKYKINKDESIYMEYICSAVKKPNFDERLAFANSVMYEYSLQRVTFEDGSPIPDVIIAEINDIMNKLTETISWQTGDLAMVDNSKFLHGRPAFTDINAKRKIFTTQTYF